MSAIGEVHNDTQTNAESYSVSAPPDEVQLNLVSDETSEASTPTGSGPLSAEQQFDAAEILAAYGLIDSRPRFLALAAPDANPAEPAVANAGPIGGPTVAVAADLTARQRALLSLDLAAQKLEQGDGLGASQ